MSELFAGLEAVKYKQDGVLRLAELKEDRRTGEKRYKLIVNGETLSVGVRSGMVVGDLFITDVYNLLMLMEIPAIMGSRISKRKLMKYEYILNSEDEEENGFSVFGKLNKVYGF